MRKTVLRRKPKKGKTNAQPVSSDRVLKGWAAIAAYLGQPVAVAQRWAKSGMPVQRQERSMTANPNELSEWLGKEANTKVPVHIAHHPTTIYSLISDAV